MSDTSSRSFLDQLFAQARDLATRGEDAAARRLGVGEDADARSAMRKTALAAGVAGLVLGTRGGRRLARTGITVGGLGLLGKVAWDAMQARGAAPAVTAEETPVHQLTDDRAEDRARVIAFAMISAAKADGHIDAEERARIESAMADLPADVRSELGAALLGPADAAEVARHAGSGQERREVYAASYAVSGRDHPAEAAYLDRLATALGLTSAEVAAIEGGFGQA